MAQSVPQVEFFDYKTRKKIPSGPGVYAFFAKLQVHENLGLEKSMELYRDLCLPSPQEPPDFHHSLNKWRSLRFSGSLELRGRDLTDICERLSGIEDQEVVGEILNKLSVYLPPLYVGMTTLSLRERYQQHFESFRAESGRNDFSRRLTCRSAELGLELRVEHLMFASVPVALLNVKDKKPLECIFEEIMQIITAPPLSKR